MADKAIYIYHPVSDVTIALKNGGDTAQSDIITTINPSEVLLVPEANAATYVANVQNYFGSGYTAFSSNPQTPFPRPI